MTRDDWKRIKDIAADALDRPEHERGAYIAGRCDSDTALLREVSSLVASAAVAEPLYETPSVLIAGATAALESLAPYETPRVGDQIGPYRLVRSLGGNGTTAAYLAVRTDAEYEKRVAIKVVRRGVDSEGILQRFRGERQTLAALDHPHVARVLDAGTTAQGVPYFVTEYVDGTPIDVHCRSRRLTTRDRVDVFLRVCDALAYAHRHHAVHGDLKPGKILITAGDSPMLLDVGMATLLPQQPGIAAMTASPYASPEQVRGETIAPASDVYSLGAILYELLADRPPHGHSARTPGALDDAPGQRPRRPSQVAPPPARAGIAGVLDDIVMMALRSEPHRRYANADALSEDLRRYMGGLSVRAGAGTLAYRTGRLLRRHRLRVVEAALVAAMIGGAVMAGSPREAASGRPSSALSVAVLPFDVTTSDRDVAYLAEGFAASLTDSVTTRSGVRATLADGQAMPATGDLRAVARELAVDSLLLGELSQSRGRLSVALRLIDGRTGQRLWTRRYEARLAGLVTLRDEMTTDVLARFMPHDEARLHVPAGETADARAYELYLEGRSLWTNATDDGVRRAADAFRQAIERDPEYARAYAGLARCYTVLAMRDALRPADATPRVKDAAARAIALDGTLAAAHASLAFAQWVYDGDWNAAAAGFQRALALDPGDAAAHAWYASYLASRGSVDEAIVAIERAQAIDGRSPGIGTDAGELYYRAGQYERAQATLEAVVGAHADFAMARNVLGLVYLRTGRVRDALAQLEAAHRLDGGPRTLSTLAYAYGEAVMRTEAERARDGVVRMARDRYVPSYVLAIAHLGAGDSDAALDHLERALDEQSHSTVRLAVDPLLDPLRGHPRFEALIRRAGIPALSVN